jgi:hypothetical protein
MESAWSNGKAAYRCRHGHTTAVKPAPSRPKNAHLREDRVLPHLPALHVLITAAPAAVGRRRRTRRGTDLGHQASPADVIGYLREQQITLTYDPATGTLHVRTAEAIMPVRAAIVLYAPPVCSSRCDGMSFRLPGALRDPEDDGPALEYLRKCCQERPGTPLGTFYIGCPKPLDPATMRAHTSARRKPWRRSGRRGQGPCRGLG